MKRYLKANYSIKCYIEINKYFLSNFLDHALQHTVSSSFDSIDLPSFLLSLVFLNDDEFLLDKHGCKVRAYGKTLYIMQHNNQGFVI